MAEDAVARLRKAAAVRLSGHAHLDAFAKSLQEAMEELQVPLADRGFRKNFSRNYKILFQANPNGYRVEVLESVLDLCADIYVNRRMWYISGLAMRKGYLLQQRLSQLFSLLEKADDEKRDDLRRLLEDLDQAWMDFEKHYITDLIDIESEARQPLADCCALEAQLRKLEETDTRSHTQAPSDGSSRRRLSVHRFPSVEVDCEAAPNAMPSISTISQWLVGRAASAQSAAPELGLAQLARSATERREMMEELLKKVGEVNSCANFRGRGRPVMSYHVLEAAAEDFLQIQEVSSPALAARMAFVEQVLNGFLHLRSYLFDMKDRMLEIDPQLRNNVKLQNCLVAWEDAWELGSRLLRPKEVCEALCSVVAQMAEVHQSCASFASMVDTQESELFLVLPRLVLLCALSAPEVRAPLAATLLPSHFRAKDCRSAPLLGLCFSRDSSESSEWDDLLQSFRGLEKKHSWEELVRCALQGPGEAQGELHLFLSRLEAMCFELQRSRSEEWNSCCSLLLRCMDAAALARNEAATEPPQPSLDSLD
ncbi:unnamed protein product [Effrenium voratum]|nr:unnamed protein product [Effrenium voratum]